MKLKHSLLLTLACASLLLSCGSDGGNADASSPSGDSSSPIGGDSVSSESSDEATKLTVTFDYNYDGAASTQVEVNEGETVEPPSNPTREGYLFSYWASDAEGSNSFDFSTPITESLTLYAIWLVNDENTITCTFYWNYEGAPDDGVYATVAFTSGNRMVVPADPVYEGHYFGGWYKDAACTEKFATISRYSENQVAYAYWKNIYTFEAEFTQLTGLDPETDLTCNEYGDKIGHGYSSDVSGTGLIFKDDSNSNCDASNGYFICDLYYNGAFIEFDITSDKAVSDATLIARLSAEYFDMTFTPSDSDDTSGWQVLVNGESIDYGTISITDVPTGRADASKRKFTNFNITNGLSLQEGKNVIKLYTNNSDRKDSTGTMAAMAPMIDCLYVYSDAALAMAEYNTAKYKA